MSLLVQIKDICNCCDRHWLFFMSAQSFTLLAVVWAIDCIAVPAESLTSVFLHGAVDAAGYGIWLLLLPVQHLLLVPGEVRQVTLRSSGYSQGDQQNILIK
jgi:hypothetical protein